MVASLLAGSRYPPGDDMGQLVVTWHFENEGQKTATKIRANHFDSFRLYTLVSQLVESRSGRLRKVLGRTSPDVIGIVKRQAMRPQMLITDIIASDAAIWDFRHVYSHHCDNEAPPMAGLRCCLTGRQD